uniref:Uncharacterized protein n=1 Tax=Cyclopterus lumpus TaxID=8103 RepID=A0A8C3AP68_CYCLU
MKVLVVLALFSVCNANILWQEPKSSLDLVKDAFWDYVAKATLTSADTVNQYTSALRTQVAPLTQEYMTQFTQEAEQLKARLEKDLTAVSTNLRPYGEELVAELQKQVEALKKDAAPYVEAMDPEALKAVLLQKSQELRGQLEKSVNQLQAQMVPFTSTHPNIYFNVYFTK